MSDQLQDYRRIVLECDFVNDWVPPIIASTGDLNGRKLLVKVTNNGTPVEANEQLHAGLLVNPEPNNDYYFGDMVTMTPVEGYETAAFECPIPPGSVSKPGTIRMGVAFLLDNEGGEQDVICTRPFNVNVEQGVLRVDSDDAVGEFLEGVKQAQAAAAAAKQSETNAAQSASEAAQSASQAADSAEAAAESERNAAQSASQAATSAAQAGQHETAAESSARAAAESASHASESAAAAAKSASQAADSASAADTSASNAATSESNAKQSETNAAGSATKAAASERNAKASETAAKQSETNAASSASAANESAENASQSASAASQSASQSSTSATQAAGSASAAKQSETNAASSAINAAKSASQARDLVENFNLTVGETTTSEPGTNAVVEITKQGAVYTADFTIPRGEQGPKGENTAAISSVTGSVDNNVGVPSVDVVAGGTPEQRTLDFQFHNLKGQKGQKGDKGDTGDPGATPDITMTASVDDGYGTPSVKVSKTGTAEAPSFNLALHNLKGGVNKVQHTDDLTGAGTTNSPLGVADTVARKTDIPSDYVSDSELSSQLDNYVTTETLNSRLDGYATDTELSKGLQAESSKREKQDGLLEDAISGKIAASNVKAGAGIATSVSGSDVTVSASPATINVTFNASLFSKGSLSARKAVSGLGSVNMVCPKASASNIAVCQACAPWLADHTDDSSIPTGQVQCTVSSVPTADLNFVITVLKG